MIPLMLAFSCTESAEADGAPPFPDGKAAEVIAEPSIVADIETIPEPSIVAVDQAALEDHEARSPLELLDQDEEDAEGEVQARGPIGSGEVVVDASLIPGVVVYSLPPNGGPTFAEKWSAEVMAFFGLIALFFQRRRDIRTLTGGRSPAAMVDASPDDAQRILAAQLIDARLEAEDLARQLVLMREGERRAADRDRAARLSRQSTNNLHGAELVAAMEAKGRRALEG